MKRFALWTDARPLSLTLAVGEAWSTRSGQDVNEKIKRFVGFNFNFCNVMALKKWVAKKRKDIIFLTFHRRH